MSYKERIIRFIILIVLTLLVGVVFAGRLANLQLVNGADYSQQSVRKITRTVSLSAPRGEILDRYGIPLVTNRMGFSVTLDKVLLPSDRQNEILLQLLNILEGAGITYSDSLPISMERPYSYNVVDDADTTGQAKVSRFKTAKKLAEDATAGAAVDKLIADYGLEGYSPADARRLMGLRYDMEQREFSITNPFTLATDVDIQTVTRIKERQLDFPGVEIEVEPIREYVAGQTAAHILGRTSSIFKTEIEEYKEKGYQLNDIVGRDGIEKAMEEYLRGENGVKTIEQNLLDRSTAVVDKKEAVPGNDVILTIDRKLQQVAEASLESTIKSIAKNTEKLKSQGRAETGAVAVIQVNTGEILAMASYPTFNPSTFLADYTSLNEDPLKPMFNRAIGGKYAPGSTFKMATAIAGLETGTITPSTKITDKGIYEYYASAGYRPRCWVYTDYGRTHGTINVSDALKVSCNYFFYETGRLTGIEELNRFCRLLGLGEFTGIEISGESAGILAGQDYKETIGQKWYGGDTIAAAIGQSDNAFTPLQLANYVATIVNGGTRYQARLVKSIRSYNGDQVVKNFEPVVEKDLDMDESTYNAVMQGMRSVTEDGTASNVFGKYPIAVGGKTGTTEIGKGITANGVFVAFAPFENPEIAVAVVVEHGAHGNYVAPIARDIFDAYFEKDESASQTVYPEMELLQ